MQKVFLIKKAAPYGSIQKNSTCLAQNSHRNQVSVKAMHQDRYCCIKLPLNTSVENPEISCTRNTQTPSIPLLFFENGRTPARGFFTCYMPI